MTSASSLLIALEKEADARSVRNRRLGRFLRSPSGLFGFAIIFVFLIATVVAAFWTPYPVDQPDLPNRLTPPSLQHPMGTDDVGRDVLTRIAVGARYSLTMGLVAIGLAAAMGVPIGLLAGYRAGWWDNASMRAIDVLMILPSFVLAVAIVSVLGTGIRSVIAAVAVTTIPVFARLTRSIALTLRSQDFVAAAQVAGAPEHRILLRHILPNALPPLVVQASLGIGTTILIAAALGFLGIGVQPPTPEWGAMLSRGRSYMSTAPFLVFFPGMAIALLVLGFNLLGDSLRDALDPWMQNLD